MQDEISLKVIIADDHSIFRDGLKLLLKKVPGIKKITQAGNGQEVVSLLGKELYDIVLMDIEMPVMDGIEATRLVKKQYPDVKVIALTMYTNQRYITELYDIGVTGYLLKNTTLSELNKAINLARQDEQYYCKEVADVLYRMLLKRDKMNKKQEDNLEQITVREREVLQLICEQYSTEEIAEKLFLSAKTIKRHRQILFDKTHSKNLAGLVLFAVKTGIYKVYVD